MTQTNWPPPAPPPFSGPARPAIEGEYATFGARVGALLIDVLIMLVPIGAAAVVLAAAAGSGADTETLGAGAVVAVLIFYAVALLYHPLTMMRKGTHNGQTYGKQAVGIRVVRDTGSELGFWYSVLRESIAKGFLGPLTLGLTYLWPLWDDRNQGLHDKVVGTFVVRA